jgi:hypothetical protein
MRYDSIVPHRARSLPIPLLAAGDLAVYLVATALGFVTHRELSLDAAGRMLATWIPFAAAWFAVAPWLGLFRREEIAGLRNLGRVLAAALISAPIGAWLRSLWLGSGVVGIFVLVMAAVTAGLMLIWRAVLGRALQEPGARS